MAYIRILASCALASAASAQIVYEDNFDARMVGDDATSFGSGWVGGQLNLYTVANDGSSFSGTNYLNMESRSNNWSFVNQDDIGHPVTTLSFDLIVPSTADQTAYLRIAPRGDANSINLRNIDIGTTAGGLEHSITADTKTHFDIVVNTSNSAINYDGFSLAGDSIAVYIDGVEDFNAAASNSATVVDRFGIWMKESSSDTAESFHMDNLVIREVAYVAPDVELIQTSGGFVFGSIYHPTGSTQTVQSATYRNSGVSEDLTIDSISLSDNGSGVFSITSAPSNGTVIAPGEQFTVEITATGGTGPRATEGSLAINTTHAGSSPDQDRVNAVTASISAPGDLYAMLSNWTLDGALENWGGNAQATDGLTSISGARIPGIGDDRSNIGTVFAGNLEQSFSPTGVSNFDLEFDVAIPDFNSFTGGAPSDNDRSFNLAIMADGALPGTGAFSDTHGSNTIINLLYCPAGVTGDANAGFFVYDDTSGFTRLSALGTMTGSTGFNADGSPPNTSSIYRIKIEGRDFGSGSAAYSIAVTDPGMTTNTITGLTDYRGADPTTRKASAVVFTSHDAPGSETNPATAEQPTFWVDDVLATLPGSSIPVTFFDADVLPGAPKFIPGMSKSIFTVAAVGSGPALDITAVSFTNPDLSLVSPALPLSIPAGTSQDFVVMIDGSAAPGLMTETVTLTTNDSFSTNQEVDLKLRVFPSNSVPLVDFDDGFTNGINDSTVLNGGFEEGTNGQSVDATPAWTSKAGSSSEQLTFNSDVATGNLRGWTASWRNPGADFIPVIDLLPDDWSFEEGDTFSVKFRWKPGTGFDINTHTLNCVMHARYADGTLITPVEDRPIQVSSTTQQSTDFNTVTIATGPVPSDSIWLGLGFRFILEAGDSAVDTYALIDDVSVIGHFQTGDSYPAANPNTAILPETSFELKLEEVIDFPDSGTGNNAPARIEQISPALDGSNKLFAADQRGKVYTFTPGDPSPTLYFDFGANVPDFRNGDTQSGLRGFAFHPDAHTPATPGYQKMYTAIDVETTDPDESHKSVLFEWTLDGSGNVIAGSRRTVLEQSQPRGDHNIGKIGFNPNLTSVDPDYGHLYITYADGGNHRSEQAGGTDVTVNPNSQDNTNFLGCMLRINPLQSGPAPYTVPGDNPFIGQLGINPEIWAYGLRNPHQFSWDTGGNGDLLIADIGQSNAEEVNIGWAGANYGWLYREGSLDITGTLPDNPMVVNVLPPDHATDRFTYPALQYDHDFDNLGQDTGAIAGGFVYRGSRIHELKGKYVFGNFGTFGNFGETTDYQNIFVVDADQLQLRDDFTDFESIHSGFLAPMQKLRLIDNSSQPIELLDLVRTKTGNPGQNRADMRFGIGPDGEVYVTSKKAGTIWRFVSLLDSFTALYPGLPADGAGDANGNGLTDYFEYAAGFDPTAPGFPGALSSVTSDPGGTTYSHPTRTGASDVFINYEYSTTLAATGQPGGWAPLLENTHYTLDDTNPNLLELDLLPGFVTGKDRLFLRHEFSTGP